MQFQCGRNKEVGWKDRQKYISLAISSNPQAGTAHMPSGFSADRIQKISLFLTSDMSIWRRPASFTILAVCKDTDWPGLQIGSAQSLLKSVFFAIGVVENQEKQTHTLGRGGGKVTLLFLCSWNLWCKYLCMRQRGILGSSFCPV